MNTTELFKFRFVDREHEREVITNFFNNKKSLRKQNNTMLEPVKKSL